MVARYSGGPVTHRALTGARRTATTSGPDAWRHEVLYTLQCIQQIRARCAMTELTTVHQAREAGLTWEEISVALGVTRQSAWGRWHDLEGDSHNDNDTHGAGHDAAPNAEHSCMGGPGHNACPGDGERSVGQGG